MAPIEKKQTKTQSPRTARTAMTKGAPKSGKAAGKTEGKRPADLERYPSLSAAYNDLAALMAGADRDEALVRHKIGGIVSAAKSAPDKYGKRAVATLAELLGVDDSTLRDYADVAETWSEAELEKLLARKNDRGRPITFSHLRVLCEVADSARRNSLIERTLTDGLSVRELDAVVRGKTPRRKPRPEDRPAVQARSVVAWLEGQADQVERRVALLVDVAKLSPTPEILKLVGDAVAKELDLADRAKVSAEMLAEVYEELTTKAGAQGSERSEYLALAVA